MNLLTLQDLDYVFSCQPLPEIKKDSAGLFMFCHATNDTDNYLMDWCQIKTLHNNIKRLETSLAKVLDGISDE